MIDKERVFMNKTYVFRHSAIGDASDQLCKINADGTTEYNWPLIAVMAAQWQPYDPDLIRCVAKLLLPLRPVPAA
jgi:hypothetical protein